MVLQQESLFSGSIADNLRWGDADATDAQLMDACEQASIADYIEELLTRATLAWADGVNLSGGQKQRLCIARALLKKPKIIILDDSTSAVDMATDKRRSRRSFKTHLKDMTTIIVAQRIATIEDADRQVLVLDNGRINAFASHGSLRSRIRFIRIS